MIGNNLVNVINFSNKFDTAGKICEVTSLADLSDFFSIIICETSVTYASRIHALYKYVKSTIPLRDISVATLKRVNHLIYPSV